MCRCLCEAETRIDDNSRWIDAGVGCDDETLSKRKRNITHEVRVLDAALVVHHDHTDVVARSDDRRHLGVPAQPPHIVDDRSTCIEGSARHLRLARVDADGQWERARQSLDHRQHATALLTRGHGRGIRPRALAAHIDDVGAVLRHLGGDAARGPDVAGEPVPGERVRRDIEDAHDQRAAAELEAMAARDEWRRRRPAGDQRVPDGPAELGRVSAVSFEEPSQRAGQAQRRHHHRSRPVGAAEHFPAALAHNLVEQLVEVGRQPFERERFYDRVVRQHRQPLRCHTEANHSVAQCIFRPREQRPDIEPCRGSHRSRDHVRRDSGCRFRRSVRRQICRLQLAG